MDAEKRVTARVGIFVMLGIVLLAAIVFLLGGERGVFASYNEYTASFETIDGLKPGSPVRLAGVEVGTVEEVRFYDDPGEKRVQVRFQVLARYADRIRADSKASVGSRGVLGDKAIDVTLGSADQPVVEPGGELLAASGSDFTDLVKKGSNVLDNAVAITADLRDLIAAYNTPAFKEDVATLVSSTRDVIEKVQKGDGALHALIYDAETGVKLKRVLGEAADAAARAESALGRVDGILAQVQRGDGLVGSLFYDPAGKEILGDLAAAANELGALAEAIRTEEGGLLHQLVYGGGEGSPDMGAELAAAARDLRQIVGRINAGEGSLGALINDPTVYEDLKTVLGNVRRNRIVRELVRYSISQSDEIERYGKKE